MELTEAEQNRLIIANMEMVPALAAKYRGQKGIPFEDLVAAGREGLVRAARCWRQGGKFTTFAFEGIENQISHFVRDWEEFESATEQQLDEREWFEWSNDLYRVPYESWSTLEATPEEILDQFQTIAHRRNALLGAMISLDRRERAIFMARFITEPQQTLESIARHHRISYARTVHLLMRALKKLRQVIEAQEQKANSDRSIPEDRLHT